MNVLWGQSSVVQPNPGLPNSVNYYFEEQGMTSKIIYLTLPLYQILP